MPNSVSWPPHVYFLQSETRAPGRPQLYPFQIPLPTRHREPQTMAENKNQEPQVFRSYVWQRSRGRAGVYRGPRYFPSLGRFMITLTWSHCCRASWELMVVPAGVLEALSRHWGRRTTVKKGIAAASPVLGPRQDGDPWPCGGKGLRGGLTLLIYL